MIDYPMAHRRDDLDSPDHGLQLRSAERSTVTAGEALPRQDQAQDSPRFGTWGGNGWHVATVRLELVGITAEEVRRSRAYRDGQPHVAHLEVARQRALAAMLEALQPGDRVAFVHRLAVDARRQRRYAMQINCSTVQPDAKAAERRLLELEANVLVGLAAGADGYRFARTGKPEDSHASTCRHHVQLLPHGLAASLPAPVGLQAATEVPRPRAIVLPQAPSTSLFWSSALMSMLASVGSPCDVVIEFAGRRLAALELEDAARTAELLLDLPSRSVVVTSLSRTVGAATAAQVQATHAMLQQCWNRPAGVEMRVTVQGTHALPASLTRLVGHEILGGRSFDVVDPDPVPSCPTPGQLTGYLPAGAMLPPLLPDAMTADRLGCARSLPKVTVPVSCDGIFLGHGLTPYGAEAVCMAVRDRGQHRYLLGRSGTGKSTHLVGLIQQDIENDDGVTVIDQAGELCEQVLALIPEHRKKDVILLDFSDVNHSPGLNPLQLTGDHPELERNFIVRDLSQIFQRLYGQVPESMGPMFQLYMRAAVSLAMEDPDGCATLLDIPRLLADDQYREYLLRNCRDQGLKDLWVGILQRVSGDHELKNLAVWVMNKFAEFTENALVRPIVGQPRSTIDFRPAMDERKIVLIDLSKKGLLGDLDVQFLGMVLLSRLLSAAFSRANVGAEARAPHHVYIDEFHNLMTLSSASIETMFAESRKYGITLTVAHQNLAQLPDRVAQSVLANAGLFAFFRLGPHDSETLAPYVGPHFSAEDLTTLADHHAVVQLKMSNVPSRPFLMRTELPRPRPGVAYADPAEIASYSRQLYFTPAAAVRRHIDARRNAYVGRLSPIEAGLSAALQKAMADRKVTALADLLGWTKEDQLALRMSASTAQDRRVLRSLGTLAAQTRERNNCGL